jgi:hypothetical protein
MGDLILFAGIGVVVAFEVGRELYRRSKEVGGLRSQVAACSVRPQSAIQGGRVQIEGRAVAIMVSTAPLSGRPVIGLRVKIEKLALESAAGGTGGPVLTWGPVVEAMHMNDFEVEDGTGRARVRTASCYPLLAAEPTVTMSVDQLLRSPLVEVLRHQRYPEHWLVGARSIRVTEYLLEPGETVFVFGEAHREIDPDAPRDYRGAVWRLVISAPLGGWVMVSDQDRDTLLRSMGRWTDLFHGS